MIGSLHGLNSSTMPCRARAAAAAAAAVAAALDEFIESTSSDLDEWSGGLMSKMTPRRG